MTDSGQRKITAAIVVSGLIGFLAACSDSSDMIYPEPDQNIFVLAGADVGGSGTEQSPYQSLAEVEANTVEGDSIVVLYSDVALDGGIELKAGQHLSGRAGLNSVKPRISNTSSDFNEASAVVAADNTVIENLHITNAYRHGIYFVNNSHITVRGNLIENINMGGSENVGGGSGIHGGAKDGDALDILIENNEVRVPSHDLSSTRGVYLVATVDGILTAVVQGNSVSDVNGKGFQLGVSGNGKAEFDFIDNSARATGPGNADSLYIVGGDSGVITVDVFGFMVDNSAIERSDQIRNMGIEVFAAPLIEGYGTAAQIDVTIDEATLYDSPGDGIFVGNALPEATVSVSIRNSVILRAAGRVGGGIGVLGAIPGYSSYEPPFPNAKVTVSVESTDVIATRVENNAAGLPNSAVGVMFSNDQDVYDFGGGATGSAGLNRFLENTSDYFIASGGVSVDAIENYYGGGAPLTSVITGTLNVEPFLEEDPRPEKSSM